MPHMIFPFRDRRRQNFVTIGRVDRIDSAAVISVPGLGGATHSATHDCDRSRQRFARACRCSRLAGARARFGAANYFFLLGRTQPSIVLWRGRATVSLPAGTLPATVEPAPTVAPAPTVIGATSTLLEPMCASSPMTVLCLKAPS